MSVSSESSCSSVSRSETESSCGSSVYHTANSEEYESEFQPYDDSVEPLASVEEIAQCEETRAQEEEENVLQHRFNASVEVVSW